METIRTRKARLKMQQVNRLMKEIQRLGVFISLNNDQNVIEFQLPQTYTTNVAVLKEYERTHKSVGNPAYEADFSPDLEFDFRIEL